jgi:hypothetical protein
MSFTLEIFPDEPILYSSFHHDFDFASEMPELAAQCNAALDASPEPLYLISNALEYQFSVSDLITGANMATRGEKPPFFHPNVRKVIWVTNSKLLELGAKGINSPTFGNLEIEVFHTLEEALAYCRSPA